MAADARPLRVALCTPPPASSGGIGRLVEYERERWRHDPSVRVAVIDSRGEGGPAASLVTVARAAARLTRLGLRRQADGVHVNLSSRGSTVRKSVLMLASRAVGLPYVVHLHGSGWDDFYRGLPAPARHAVRARLAAATRVIALGDHWRRFLVDEVGLERARVVVLNNATPGPSERTPRSRGEGEPLRIAFVGRVGERKGVFELVEALAAVAEQLGPFVLEVAGDGDTDRFQRVADGLGIGDRVLVHGWVDPEAVADLLARAHLFVLPSAAENQPMSIIEAMAWAVPVIATDVAAVPEVVRDGRNGRLIPPHNAAALREALVEAADEPTRIARAGRARADWEASYSIDGHWSALRAIWRTAFQR